MPHRLAPGRTCAARLLPGPAPGGRDSARIALLTHPHRQPHANPPLPEKLPDEGLPRPRPAAYLPGGGLLVHREGRQPLRPGHLLDPDGHLADSRETDHLPHGGTCGCLLFPTSGWRLARLSGQHHRSPHQGGPLRTHGARGGDALRRGRRGTGQRGAPVAHRRPHRTQQHAQLRDSRPAAGEDLAPLRHPLRHLYARRGQPEADQRPLRAPGRDRAHQVDRPHHQGQHQGERRRGALRGGRVHRHVQRPRQGPDPSRRGADRPGHGQLSLQLRGGTDRLHSFRGNRLLPGGRQRPEERGETGRSRHVPEQAHGQESGLPGGVRGGRKRAKGRGRRVSRRRHAASRRASGRPSRRG